MSEIQKAKLFKNGGSQAIRIPAQWRFEEDEVFVRFDEDRNELIISERNPAPMFMNTVAHGANLHYPMSRWLFP